MLSCVLDILQLCGRQGRWILPLGLIGGFVLPWAAEPLSHLIGPCIGMLLFLAVVRITAGPWQADSSVDTQRPFSTGAASSLLILVLLAQLVMPLLVYLLATAAALDDSWRLVATLVAAAPPISGSPNLALLLRGDGQLALRWLIAGTLLLPLTCLPVLYLFSASGGMTGGLNGGLNGGLADGLADGAAASGLWEASITLLLLILASTVCGLITTRMLKRKAIVMSMQAIDGASSIILAVMVVGLMSAFHAPNIAWRDVLIMLALAVAINAGYQCIGVLVARLLNQPAKARICAGVVNGNRNIALYLTALPASFTEPLLLFIACYQIPMYLTPLVGHFFYRRLE